MKIHKILLTIATLFISGCNKKQKIITTNDISEIQSITSKLGSGDLAIFDCDDVLSFNPYFTNTGAISIIPLFHRIKTASGIHTDENAIIAMSRLLQESRYIPVDKGMPNVVSMMQKNGVKTLVLTQLGAGAYGEITSLAEWRISNLEKIGYTFRNAWSNLKDTSFPDLKQKINFPRVVVATPDIPYFMGGMLFAGGFQKQEVVERFLQYANVKPKTLFFIDDIKKNVESMASFARNLGISYIGIHYTAVEDLKYSQECVDGVRQARAKIDSLYPKHEAKK